MQDDLKLNATPIGDNFSKKAEIANHISSGRLRIPTDMEISVDRAIKLPFDQLPALGVAFSSLPATFRTITSTLSDPTLLQVTDKLGNALDPNILQHFNDGSGIMGSFRDAKTGFGQARFHTVESSGTLTSAVIPYDPTTLFMAAALMQINQKLDAIQKTQEEMFDYLRQKDKAEVRGNIQTLTRMLESYCFNWNNDIWCENSHMKALDIRQESEKAIVHLRAQIFEKLQKRGIVESRITVSKRLDEVLDRLKEYQLVVYAYSFAAFLEPMLSENHNEDYLSSVITKIEEHSLRYRELYTDCYNAIEHNSDSSIDSAMLNGLSFMSGKLGRAIASTPVGEHTPLDEALSEASEDLGGINEQLSDNLMAKLHQAKVPNVAPFKENIELVNALYNHPLCLLADSKNIYLLPIESQL